VEPFTFYGFAPRSGAARQELLEQLAVLRHTAVLYESPARLTALLGELITACGADRPAAVARELTKLHESVVRGTLEDVLRYYEGGAVRGEVVVVLGGAAAPAPVSEADAASLARELLTAGSTPRSAAREIAQRLRMSRNDAYSLVLSLGEGGREKE
jgi:16S rRNA (cytidine1402-2'-O)-methyltransferase